VRLFCSPQWSHEVVTKEHTIHRQSANQHLAWHRMQTLHLPNDDFERSDRSFGRTFPNAFSKHFSRVGVLDLGYKLLKSASKTHSERFVQGYGPTFQNRRFGDHKLVTKIDTSINRNDSIIRTNTSYDRACYNLLYHLASL
jgi:hypothetical protein